MKAGFLTLVTIALTSVAAADAAQSVNVFAGPRGNGVACCFGDPINPVTIDVEAGDYTISDAWGQPGALYDAWNETAGAPNSWLWEYRVFSFNGSAYTLLADVGSGHTFNSQAEASAFGLSLSPLHLHLPGSTTLAFGVSDYVLIDNVGGVSLVVAEVPEPSSAALLWVGLALGSGAAYARGKAANRGRRKVRTQRQLDIT